MSIKSSECVRSCALGVGHLFTWRLRCEPSPERADSAAALGPGRCVLAPFPVEI